MGKGYDRDGIILWQWLFSLLILLEDDSYLLVIYRISMEDRSVGLELEILLQEGES